MGGQAVKSRLGFINTKRNYTSQTLEGAAVPLYALARRCSLE